MNGTSGHGRKMNVCGEMVISFCAQTAQTKWVWGRISVAYCLVFVSPSWLACFHDTL